MRIIKSLMGVLCGCLMVLVCSNSVLAVGCTGQYFGQSQCKLRTPLTGGSCQLNSDLGIINTANLSDRINDWKWSYCSGDIKPKPTPTPTIPIIYGPSRCPILSNDDTNGCTFLYTEPAGCEASRFENVQYCTLSGGVLGYKMREKKCACEETAYRYDCAGGGGTTDFYFAVLSSTWNDFDTTCQPISGPILSTLPLSVVDEQTCREYCKVGQYPTPTGRECYGRYFGESQCKSRAPSQFPAVNGTCQLNPNLGKIDPNGSNFWKWSWCASKKAVFSCNTCTGGEEEYGTRLSYCVRDYCVPIGGDLCRQEQKYCAWWLDDVTYSWRSYPPTNETCSACLTTVLNNSVECSLCSTFSMSSGEQSFCGTCSL